MLKSYSYSNFVNGPSCSYAKLKTYANCARAEKRPAVAVAAPPTPVAKEGYYLDPSVDSLPGNANSGEKNYTPSYTVPDYAPINIDSLSKGDASCGGYKKILTAYSGMNGSSCTTNYTNN